MTFEWECIYREFLDRRTCRAKVKPANIYPNNIASVISLSLIKIILRK